MRRTDAAVLGFVERSVSQATRESYRRTVAEFRRFVGRDLTEVGPDDVRRWRDALGQLGQRPATIARKLSTLRSLYAYLQAAGLVTFNPASPRLVPPPELGSERAGRALTPKEVRYLLVGPDRSTSDGARDYAMLLALARLGLRVSELCALRVSSFSRSPRGWAIRFTQKGGEEREVPVPDEVREAVSEYLRLDKHRRELAKSAGEDAYVFQPHVNYRTLEFARPLTRRHVKNIVARWADYAGLGKLSPHDLRRTAITRALELGLSYYQVQLMSGHKDPKTVQRYDHRRSAFEQSAINFLHYQDE